MTAANRWPILPPVPTDTLTHDPFYINNWSPTFDEVRQKG